MNLETNNVQPARGQAEPALAEIVEVVYANVSTHGIGQTPYMVTANYS